jgi:uncharacterized protein YqcC (DUF446 family)
MTRHVKRAPSDEHRTSAIRSQLEKIISEMHRIGMWEVQKVTTDQLKDMGAFGYNTMAFEQWLRWVFVPRVEALLNEDGPWPKSSDVGIAAIRNFDGQDKASGLVTLLCEFDALFTEE